MEKPYPLDIYQKIKERCVLTIFGATGDLTKRKLIPALYKLWVKNILPKNIVIVCTARKDFTDITYSDILKKESTKYLSNIDKSTWPEFLEKIRYYALDFKKENFLNFAKFIRTLDKKYRCNGNKIFYLATSASFFDPIVKKIKKAGMSKGKGWNRVVFEKPFGRNLKSAIKLNHCITSVFKENEIYRIDHYLGKELVQNIFVLRFGNTLFNEIWSNKFIDNIQIVFSESIGVEARGDYYEKSGAVRDMVQNHVLQVLSYIAMEQPKSLKPEHIRDKKVDVFKSLQKIKPENVVVGQYGSGTVKGEKVNSYRREEEVKTNSKTETFAALKINVNNERWKGVPIYVKTGKRLNKSYAEINIVMKDISHDLFDTEGKNERDIISIRIQPDEGIAVKFYIKSPGPRMNLYPVLMDFCHHCLFGLNTPEAYERLFHDILLGDQTLFTRWDGLQTTWRYIDQITKIIKKKHLWIYKAGSTGPEEADKLLKREGRGWVWPKGETR